MMFNKLVKEARTIRRFIESETISEEILTNWVDLARQSPSAGNLQPLRYHIVDTKEDCEKIFPFLGWAGALPNWAGPEEGERPAAYIIMLSEAEKNSPDTDIGIAAQTIQLASRAEGYGCCMMGAIKRDKIHQALDLPANLGVRLVLALGKPAETVVMTEVNDNDLKYWRDDEQVHYVPKRALKDILV